MSTDLISLVANLTFIVLMIVASIVSAGGTTTPLARLTLAIRLYWVALFAVTVALVANVADAGEDGWIYPALSVATLTVTALTMRAVRTRRRLKGDRVVADAERTVRDWTGDLR